MNWKKIAIETLGLIFCVGGFIVSEINRSKEIEERIDEKFEELKAENGEN